MLLEFVWLHNQTLDKVRIVKSSGHEILDSNVLKVIARAAKNFPQYEKSVRIQIPIVYNLKD
ncbi:energy transducer TonB family protein [Campylobacter sp. MIT 12-8780]|uniref:energy transducer TonB family protein n=1 Tax=unclassified Campylobacter TaxID=2593542 RepID=UPI003FA4821F